MKDARSKSGMLISIVTISLLIVSLELAAGRDGRLRPVQRLDRGASVSEKTTPVDLKITAVTVDNVGSLRLEFTLRDSFGSAIKGLTRQDIASICFGRMGYEDEGGLRTAVGQPKKVWLSYYRKSAADGNAAEHEVRSGKDDKDILQENGDGSYELKVDNPGKILTKYSYSPSAENGVILCIKRGNGTSGSDTFYWRPSAAGKANVPVGGEARLVRTGTDNAAAR